MTTRTVNQRIVLKLLEYGGRIENKAPSGYVLDTLYHQAIRIRSFCCLSWLLAHSSKVDVALDPCILHFIISDRLLTPTDKNDMIKFFIGRVGQIFTKWQVDILGTCDTSGSTPLSLAVQNELHEIVSLLFQASQRQVLAPNKRGFNPLHYACYADSPRILSSFFVLEDCKNIVLQALQQVTFQERMTAGMCAIDSGRISNLLALSAHLPNERLVVDSQGRALEHYAAKQKNPAFLATVIRYLGYRNCPRDHDGFTPTETSLAEGNYTVFMTFYYAYQVLTGVFPRLDLLNPRFRKIRQQIGRTVCKSRELQDRLERLKTEIKTCFKHQQIHPFVVWTLSFSRRFQDITIDNLAEGTLEEDLRCTHEALEDESPTLDSAEEEDHLRTVVDISAEDQEGNQEAAIDVDNMEGEEIRQQITNDNDETEDEEKKDQQACNDDDETEDDEDTEWRIVDSDDEFPIRTTKEQ